MAFIQAELDKELEWKPYECTQNVSQAEYAELVKGISGGSARYMTDDEALDWVCREFGFDRSQVTILHEIDEQEINRHNYCRASGRKIDRRPVYCAADYHYIRFNAGCGAWQWRSGAANFGPSTTEHIWPAPEVTRAERERTYVRFGKLATRWFYPSLY